MVRMVADFLRRIVDVGALLTVVWVASKRNWNPFIRMQPKNEEQYEEYEEPKEEKQPNAPCEDQHPWPNYIDEGHDRIGHWVKQHDYGELQQILSNLKEPKVGHWVKQSEYDELQQILSNLKEPKVGHYVKKKSYEELSQILENMLKKNNGNHNGNKKPSNPNHDVAALLIQYNLNQAALNGNHEESNGNDDGGPQDPPPEENYNQAAYAALNGNDQEALHGNPHYDGRNLACLDNIEAQNVFGKFVSAPNPALSKGASLIQKIQTTPKCILEVKGDEYAYDGNEYACQWESGSETFSQTNNDYFTGFTFKDSANWRNHEIEFGLSFIGNSDLFEAGLIMESAYNSAKLQIAFRQNDDHSDGITLHLKGADIDINSANAKHKLPNVYAKNEKISVKVTMKESVSTISTAHSNKQLEVKVNGNTVALVQVSAGDQAVSTSIAFYVGDCTTAQIEDFYVTHY